MFPQAKADNTKNREYQIKGAFLYNFLKFIDWPKEKETHDEQHITIGIVGKNPFGKALDAIKGKSVGDKTVFIKYYPGYEDINKSAKDNEKKLREYINDLKKCHLVFICPSEKEDAAKILKSVSGVGVLTAADTEGFLETGGCLNFVIDDKKVKFEVHAGVLKKENIKIRSKLMRLAVRVVE